MCFVFRDSFLQNGIPMFFGADLLVERVVGAAEFAHGSLSSEKSDYAYQQCPCTD
jgi:hypothetical protein